MVVGVGITVPRASRIVFWVPHSTYLLSFLDRTLSVNSRAVVFPSPDERLSEPIYSNL